MKIIPTTTLPAAAISDGIAIQTVPSANKKYAPKNIYKLDIYLVENCSFIKSSLVAIIVSNNAKCDGALCGEAAPVNCTTTVQYYSRLQLCLSW